MRLDAIRTEGMAFALVAMLWLPGSPVQAKAGVGPGNDLRTSWIPRSAKDRQYRSIRPSARTHSGQAWGIPAVFLPR